MAPETVYILDNQAPLRSLREASGLDGAAFARLRGVQPPSQHEAEAIGDRILLSTLLKAADTAGFVIQITARKKST